MDDTSNAAASQFFLAAWNCDQVTCAVTTASVDSAGRKHDNQNKLALASYREVYVNDVMQ